MISAYAKSYKEAQLYFFPVYLVSLFPSVAGVLPGIRLRSAVVAVPLANVSVAVKEIMVDKFDWPMIGVAFAAMTGAAHLDDARVRTDAGTGAADHVERVGRGRLGRADRRCFPGTCCGGTP